MRIWKASPQADKLPVSQAGLARLMAAITNEDSSCLPQAILDLVRSEVDMLNCALFMLPASGRPWLLGHAESRPSRAPVASGAYVEHFHQRDLALQEVLRGSRASPSGAPILLHQSAQDILDPAYRSACYEEAGTVQRFGIFRRLPQDNSLLIGIYRSACARALSPSDLRYLEFLADCLSEAVVQRFRSMPHAATLSAQKLDRLQATLQTRLSRREYDLVLSIARGMTLAQAAKVMGVKPTTAITYRNRGFAKLNVRTQQELFARLMELTNP